MFSCLFQANTDCWNWYGTHNCTCKVGFTGDPYAGCVDINECAYEDLNICAGGLYPHGVDVDVFGLDHNFDDDHQWVSLGETEDDGYSQVMHPLQCVPCLSVPSDCGDQVVQFEVKGEVLTPAFRECRDVAVCPDYYFFVLGKPYK